MKLLSIKLAALLASISFGTLLSNAVGAPNTKDVTTVSVTNTERLANGDSTGAGVSSDGSKVLLVSSATNLTTTTVSDTQLYLRDRGAAKTTLLSRDADGAPGNGAVSAASFEPSATYAVFATAATNLAGSSAAASSIYRVTLADGSLDLISNTTVLKQAASENTAPDISDDGQRIVFLTNRSILGCSGSSNLVISQAGVLSCLSSPALLQDYSISEARIAGDGSVVAAVVTDGSTRKQVYVIPVATPASFERISEFGASPANSSAQEIDISGDGTRVVFSTTATNLISPSPGSDNKAVYLYDSAATPRIKLISKDAGGQACSGESSQPAISQNGLFIAFVSNCRDIITSDNPSIGDAKQVFVYSVAGDSFYRASVKTSGSAVNGDAFGPLFIDNAGQVTFFHSRVKSISPRPRDTAENIDLFRHDTTCSSNSDGAGSTDCTDVCPYDASKESSEGACGCGLSDADRDADTVADCEDLCPDDPVKSLSRGSCGCGLSDVDLDGNGRADCWDPTSLFKPTRARFIPDGTRQSGTIHFSGVFEDGTVTYEFQFNRDGQVVRTGTLRGRTIRVRRIGLGRFTFRYRVSTTAATSRWSDRTEIKLRPRIRRGGGPVIVVE